MLSSPPSSLLSPFARRPSASAIDSRLWVLYFRSVKLLGRQQQSEPGQPDTGRPSRTVASYPSFRRVVVHMCSAHREGQGFDAERNECRMQSKQPGFVLNPRIITLEISNDRTIDRDVQRFRPTCLWSNGAYDHRIAISTGSFLLFSPGSGSIRNVAQGKHKWQARRQETKGKGGEAEQGKRGRSREGYKGGVQVKQLH